MITVPDRAGEEALSHTDGLPENTLNELISCEYYTVWKLQVAGETAVEQKYPFLLASVLNGSGTLDGVPVKKGDHFILPAGYGRAVLTGDMELILSTV